MGNQPRVIVVGCGISGIAAAYFMQLASTDIRPQITLVEQGSRLGGKVFTQLVSDQAVDLGPDSLIIASPGIRKLLSDLDLSSEMTAPGQPGSYVWARGRLRRLPPGTLFGVPHQLRPLLASGIVSPLGLARASWDLLLGSQPLSADPSIEETIRPRLGTELFENLVEPLLGGAFAGRARSISAQSTVPPVRALALDNRSLYLGIRRRQRNSHQDSYSGPMIVNFKGGLTRLVEALSSRLANCDVRTNSKVKEIKTISNGYSVTLSDGSTIEADLVVLATPAHISAGLLRTLNPQAAAELKTIPYVDVATVALSFHSNQIPRKLDATGFLVPPSAGKLITGCTWTSAKWPTGSSSDISVIRCMIGNYGDRAWDNVDNASLLQKVYAELELFMGITSPPLEHIVQRWPATLPSFIVGHDARLRSVFAALRATPQLRLVGAPYGGAGLANCIAYAEKEARSIMGQLSSSPRSVHSGHE